MDVDIITIVNCCQAEKSLFRFFGFHAGQATQGRLKAEEVWPEGERDERKDGRQGGPKALLPQIPPFLQDGRGSTHARAENPSPEAQGFSDIPRRGQ